MYSVIVNNYGKFVFEKNGLALSDAIEGCKKAIADTHGGDAWVVSDDTAHEIVGQFVEDVAGNFTRYDVNGNPRTS